MTVLIDEAIWPAHGTVWAHLVSDTDYAELHAFAATVGIPPRAFERDHYDVIAERYEAVVAAGARRATSREIVAMLHRAGMSVERTDQDGDVALRVRDGRLAVRTRGGS